MGSAKDQRISETLMQNLAESMPRERPSPALKRERKRGGIAAKRGYFERQYQPGTGETTGGIASPLTEGAAADADPEDPSSPFLARESYPAQVVTSSDGLFVWEVTPPAIITFRDNNGEPAQVRLANPYAIEE
tara:strand:+ start:16884 stop:17282 length:399 start_codon:yes stop_codon:yes gene_type:complete